MGSVRLTEAGLILGAASERTSFPARTIPDEIDISGPELVLGGGVGAMVQPGPF
jgi:hypothetical protein